MEAAMSKRWTAEELAYQAKITEVVEDERFRLERQIRRPLTATDSFRFDMWVAKYEERAWRQFYGPPKSVGARP
jgi:hypothetical protein